MLLRRDGGAKVGPRRRFRGPPLRSACPPPPPRRSPVPRATRRGPSRHRRREPQVLKTTDHLSPAVDRLIPPSWPASPGALHREMGDIWGDGAATPEGRPRGRSTPAAGMVGKPLSGAHNCRRSLEAASDGLHRSGVPPIAGGHNHPRCRGSLSASASTVTGRAPAPSHRAPTAHGPGPRAQPSPGAPPLSPGAKRPGPVGPFCPLLFFCSWWRDRGARAGRGGAPPPPRPGPQWAAPPKARGG